MHKLNCPNCDWVAEKPTERRAKIALDRHMWWEKNRDNWGKKKKENKIELEKEKRREYQRKAYAKKKQAKLAAQNKNGSHVLSKDKLEDITSFFKIMKCCPGCGRDLYKTYLGLKLAESVD